MKKISMLLYISFAVLSCYATSPNKTEDSVMEYKVKDTSSSDTDLLPLSDPEMRVSGAYYGVGITMSNLSNDVTLKKDPAKFSSKKSANQFDFSVIAGFGGNFYDKYYAGVEMEIFKRFSEKEKEKVSIGTESMSTIFDAMSGINMDVRLGHQLPEYGTLPYFTFGFTKERGSVALYNNSNGKQIGKQSYGSFYPTLGFGLEHRLNYRWNLRLDCRMSISSKDDSRKIRDYSLEGKPSKVSFRLSITRNI